MKQRGILCIWVLALLLALSGCNFTLYSGDDLLLAPQPTKNFVALQEQLRKILDGGSIYAVPQTGQNRSTVQLVDLDSDGRDEAVAFFRDGPTASTFTIYVFKKKADAYIPAGNITGHGLSLQSVEYPNLQANGKKGIAIVWGLEDGQTNALTLCDFDPDGHVNTLLSTDFLNYKFSDLTGDGTDELLTINGDGSKDRTATLYEYKAGKMSELGRAAVSREAMSIVRLTAGYLEDGLPAIFAEERPDSGTGLMTDIFVYSGAQLRNITQNTESGASNGNYRAMSVFATDIDGDHVTEVPQTVLMVGFADPTEPDALYLLDWYSYQSTGAFTLKRTTYHNVAEEWSFRLPDGWRTRVTAVKQIADGVSRTTFCEYLAEGGSRQLFTIYCCTGDQASRFIQQNNLILLSEGSSALYAASIAADPGDLSLTAEELQTRFTILTADWLG